MEDPKLAKTVVRREVTRVLTPGTAIDPSLGAEQSNYLASAAVTGSGPATVYGLALLDLSTGDFRTTEFTGPTAKMQLADELGRMRPVELLFASTGALFAAPGRLLHFGEKDKQGREDEEESAWQDGVRTKTPLDDWVFTSDHALPLLRNHFKVHSLDGLGLGGHEIAAIAAGGLLHYMQATKQGNLEHVDALRFYERSTHSMPAALQWASDYCAQLCSGHRAIWRRSTPDWMPSPKQRQICAAAKVCVALWMAYSTLSACSAEWLWIPPAPAR
jgi:DNA mismatch repair protein MutS